VERLVASWMLEHPLLQPWVHAAFVALLLCLGVLVGASLATGRPGPARTGEPRVGDRGVVAPPEPVPLAGRDGLWLALLVAGCSGLWVAVR
jgi:hypothetical protein